MIFWPSPSHSYIFNVAKFIDLYSLKFEPILAQFSTPQLKRSPSIRKTGHLSRAALFPRAEGVPPALAGGPSDCGGRASLAVASLAVEDGLEGTEASAAAAPGLRAQTQ